MPLTKLLKALIIGEIVLVTLAALVDIQYPQLLPQVLQDYNLQKCDDTSDFVALVLISCLILVIVSYVGLWRIKRWGRSLYTVANLGAYFATFFINQPEINSSLAGAFGDLSTMCSGGILILVWFTALNKSFST